MAEVDTDRYEPPCIEARTEIGPMLIGVLVNSANVDNQLP